MKKYLGLGLMLLALAVAVPVAAQTPTVAELQAQIQALMAQIAALTNANSGSNPECYNYVRDLTLGSSGEDVKALQKWLIAKGYSISTGVTAYFNNQTKQALAKYQTAIGVAATGYFGPVMRAHLASLCSSQAGTKPTVTVQSAPSLQLKYNSAGGEAALESNARLTITNGTDSTFYLYADQQPIGVERNAVPAQTGPLNVRVMEVASGNPDRMTRDGATVYELVAGQSASFTFTAQFNPQTMFAGSYAAYLGVLSGVDEDGNYIDLVLPKSYSSRMVIVGEKSPYVTSVNWDSDKGGNGFVNIWGQRLSQVNTVKIYDQNNNNAIRQIPKGKFGVQESEKISISVALEEGYYILQLSSQNGNSNRVGFAVGQSAVTPSITLLSPNGGESYKVGDTVPITWNAYNWQGTAVNIALMDSNGQVVKYLASGLSADRKGGFSWYIDGTVEGGRLASGRYKVQVYSNEKGGGPDDQSDGYFTITTTAVAPATASLSLVTPINSQSYRIGDTLGIRWQASNLSAAAKIKVNLRWSGGSCVLAEVPSTSSSYSVVISPTMCANYGGLTPLARDYSVYLSHLVPGQNTSSQMVPITIVAETPTTAAVPAVSHPKTTAVIPSTDRTDGVYVRWNIPVGAVNYAVYRCGSNSLSSCVGIPRNASRDGNDSSYLDTAATAGVYYWYAVDAQFSDSQWSGLTLSGDAGRRVPMEHPKTSVVIPSTDRTDGVYVRWNIPVGAVNYAVYRCSSSSLSSCVGIPKNASRDGNESSYLDTLAKPNTAFWYAVDAQFSDGQWSGLQLSTEPGKVLLPGQTGSVFDALKGLFR